jgi:hypothetical protein
MFLNPWYPTVMLAFEAGNVIDVRLRKIALGGTAGADESRLMVKEKLDAAFETASILMSGGDPSHVIDNYRRHVAANAARLARA